MTREFILYSRSGRTSPDFHNLHDAGRLDIVHECIVASLFLSHSLRNNVIFHAILNGPPDPPLHVKINGAKLCDVRTDLITWQHILQKIVSGKTHQGIITSKKSFQALLKGKAKSHSIFVLEEGGKNVAEIWLPENAVFVLGDHVGLPKKTEIFALRYGEKISLGKQPYLAASCITILNYLMDCQVKSCF